LALIKTLLEEGADVNQKNQYVFEGLADGWEVSHACFCRSGQAPIHKAAEYGHLSCLEWLVAKGADFHAQDGWVLLMSVTTFSLMTAMLLTASIDIACGCMLCLIEG
jgi:hypothetical protein